MDVRNDQLVIQRLKDAAEKAKHELSSTLETEVNIPFLTADATGPKHFVMNLKRSKLEDLTRELIDKSVRLTKETVSEAGFSLSDIDEVVLVGGQTRMPAIVEAVRQLFGKEPHKDINPDEVVAIGAAIQGGIMQGDVRDVLLLDVTPLSLGIETLGGVMTKMIEKNTTVPVSKTQVFSTAADNQPQVEIHVLQGERPMASDNKTLGNFALDGIPPAPRGMPQIEVSFDIDANGILNVKAKDKATGKEQKITIQGSSGLSQEEKDRMIRDAEAHAAEDEKRKKSIEERNTAETLIYTAEKALRDAGEKVSNDIRSDIESKIADLKKAMESHDNSDAIATASQSLSAAMQKIGEALYAAKPSDATEVGKDHEDNTREANAEEVK